MFPNIFDYNAFEKSLTRTKKQNFKCIAHTVVHRVTLKQSPLSKFIFSLHSLSPFEALCYVRPQEARGMK